MMGPRSLAAFSLLLALLGGCGGGSSGGDDATSDGGSGGSTRQLSSVEVIPASASKAVGGMQQFTASAHYSDGSTQTPATGVSWSSSAPAVAGVDAASGLATALSPGIAEIRAALGGITGVAQMEVTAQPQPPPEAEAVISPERIILRNGLVERSWTRSPFRTEYLVDLRNGRVWTQDSADFALNVLGAELPSDLLEVRGEPVVEESDNSALRLTLTLAPAGLGALPAGFTVTRVIELAPDVAGMRLETWVNSPVPLAISGYSLDEARPQGDINAEMHSFRAGADWREPEWAGPPLVIGDPHPGSWRFTTAGATVSGTAQWLSLADGEGRRLFYVLERNDYASSQMSFAGGRARAHVDLGRDILYLGPLEEEGHVENPTPLSARLRVIVPGTPLRLEPVFTGVAADGDDEPWQHYKYLANYRMPPYRREVTFNSNGVDSNIISTGAKDDMNFAEVQRQASIAEQLGIETFILDDGWQARSGDWCPDSVSDDPACQEPRLGTDPKFEPRFPDSTFSAVRQEIAPMNLGLWMTPLHFNPNAVAFQNNPQWACLPISLGLLALNLSDPDGGSNDAGIVQWNPEALAPDGTKFIDYMEGRIRRAIDDWGVKYFKFDFTAWLDCGGIYPVDIYGYRESFMAMLDRVIADHPDVTIQMDETNDYRLFPFEAIARGPTWYQNGSPLPNEALHANFLLARFMPLYALGRNALRAGDLANYPVDYQMAVALLSHMTFFNDLTQIPEAVVPRIRVWTDYYKAHRAELASLVYPLLDEDPLATANWAAFQSWNPETGRGALLVYRQDSDQATRTLRLRNVAAGSYRLYRAPEEAGFIDYSADQLRAGIEVTLPEIRTAAVFRIEKLAGIAP
jgi:hypothetical protein